MGTVSKPNTFSASTTASSSEVNDNFDTIYNEFNDSIAAANLASDAVTTAKIADANVTTAKIADDAVTPAKLGAHTKVGVIDGGTSLGSTGNLAVTGVGFTPKLVQFLIGAATSSGDIAQHGLGFMDDSGSQFSNAVFARGTTNEAERSGLDATKCIIASSGSGNVLECSYVSMDSDGFTINVDTASTGQDVGWIAYG